MRGFMRKLLNCRRSIIALVGIGCLTWLGLENGTDVSIAISAIVAGIAGSNAWENRGANGK
jgi:hypothetical protein